MSPVLTVTYIAIVLFILTQFGGRLSASRSLVWWLVFAFIGVAVFNPSVLAPMAQLFGVELVSNLVFGGCIMLIFLQLLDQNSFNSANYRRTRGLVASLAAEDFARKAGRAAAAATPADKPWRALVVLPCYNEELSLPSVIPAVQAMAAGAASQGLSIDYCFVDDGSVDRSSAVLVAHCPQHFVRHQVNIGVGGVIMTAFHIQKNLHYDYVVQCDGDGQHPIALIPSFVALAHQRQLDLLIGSRFAAPTHGVLGTVDRAENARSTTLTRRFGALLIRAMLGVFGPSASVSDPTSGFRVYSQRAGSLLLRTMPDDYPEPESIILAKLHALRLGEVLVAMTPRATGTSTLSRFKSVVFMVKVGTALLGLRLRSLIN